ncbi:interferon-induced protein 44-like [Brachyhypopomus gauderio]|uniref:interferon-induced protein 44-like n=1 Tax=Brachyhypopomus gauderio TaxID=698409 RepID=UPI004042AFC6
MSSAASQLDLEREKQLLKLFTQPVKLGLLYKGSIHGYKYNTLLNKFNEEGKCVIILYLVSGAVRGIYVNEKLSTGSQGSTDKGAFLFDVSKQGAAKYPVLDPSKAFACNYGNKGIALSTLQFGSAIELDAKDIRIVNFCSSDIIYTSTGWPTENTRTCEVELHRVQDVGHLIPDWRHLSWTVCERDSILEDILSFKSVGDALPRVRALLLGPAGAGKSSFIVSARSVMNKRVVHLPIVGKAINGFTKKLKTYEIGTRKGGAPTVLTLCDAMAVGHSDSPGLSLSDALAVIKGHVPEGYKFNFYTPISEKVTGHRTAPSLKEQVHCVLFVLNASELESYSSSLLSTLRELHSEISDLGIPQLILLTHIDKVCHAVHEDVKFVYSSRTLQETMEKAAELVHMPVSSVLPIKNYASEHAVNCNMDILILDAICHVLQAIDDMLEDQHPEDVHMVKEEPLRPL